MTAGMFITFEGLDFSGKSTQLKLLVEKLQQEKFAVMELRDPGGTSIGERIRAILLDRKSSGMADFTELFLFSASRAQLVHEIVKPALAAGTTVVCDRFFDSTTAYQGWGRGLPLEAIKTINAAAAAGAIPDITYVLDIPVIELERRMLALRSTADRMESSGRSFYERVRNGYLHLADEEERFEVIDGTGSIETIHDQVWRRFQKALASRVLT